MFRCELEETERLWDVFQQVKQFRKYAKLLVFQSRWAFQLDNIFNYFEMRTPYSHEYSQGHSGGYFWPPNKNVVTP